MEMQEVRAEFTLRRQERKRAREKHEKTLKKSRKSRSEQRNSDHNRSRSRGRESSPNTHAIGQIDLKAGTTSQVIN